MVHGRVVARAEYDGVGAVQISPMRLHVVSGKEQGTNTSNPFGACAHGSGLLRGMAPSTVIDNHYSNVGHDEFPRLDCAEELIDRRDPRRHGFEAPGVCRRYSGDSRCAQGPACPTGPQRAAPVAMAAVVGLFTEPW